ncbi:MAG: peptidoglycan DD-metalloendopeptidase family protein [Patescibacteria group bacterium]|jgi:murein DD-endopeptidase MepM/ murein hydrolase activator NlpD
MKTLLLPVIFMLSLMFINNARAQVTWTKSGLDTLNISKLITTPYGVFASEFDTRLWLVPYNGIRISKDLGNTWTNAGLSNRGVTDIVYDNGVIYASTYYSGTGFKNGLYYSINGGTTWQYIDFPGSASKIYAYNGTLYLAKVGAGLWISTDRGLTWERKIGEQYSDYEITALAGKDGMVMAGSIKHTYISSNDGGTWQVVQDLETNTITNVSFGEDSIIAVGRENKIFRSVDNGSSWQNIQHNPNLQPERILYFEGNYYLGQKDLTNGVYDVYRSNNSGDTWDRLGLSKAKSIISITGVYALPSKVLAFVNTDGVYISDAENSLASFPLLQIPWRAENKNELVGRIYSHFDHQYPLLGYNYYKEPQEEAETTLNYLGEKQEMPDLYYSSHDGYDFSLQYGTDILAAHEGLAEYYYCKPCGNTIKINHPNGYQTTYMHLQENGLVTKGTKWVESGEVIGKVGMTGNTTGPHLHFAITQGGVSPENRVDPFGWQSRNLLDPWKWFSWSDVLGTHVGPQSTYLWKDLEGIYSKYLLDQNVELTLDSKKVNVTSESIQDPATVTLKTGKMPILPKIQSALSYIIDTALSLSALDNMGNNIENLLEPATIEISLPEVITQNVIKESLKIYLLNKNTKLWEPLETVYDEVANKLIAETTHFSDFAVFGEKSDLYTPDTSVSVTGNYNNYWYSNNPTISFATQNPSDRIFYSIEGDHWNEYIEPFVLEKVGVVVISYRSQAENGNLEETQDKIIKINTTGRYVKTVIIKGSQFSVP